MVAPVRASHREPASPTTTATTVSRAIANTRRDVTAAHEAGDATRCGVARATCGRRDARHGRRATCRTRAPRQQRSARARPAAGRRRALRGSRATCSAGVADGLPIAAITCDRHRRSGCVDTGSSSASRRICGIASGSWRSASARRGSALGVAASTDLRLERRSSVGIRRGTGCLGLDLRALRCSVTRRWRAARERRRAAAASRSIACTGSSERNVGACSATVVGLTARRTSVTAAPSSTKRPRAWRIEFDVGARRARAGGRLRRCDEQLPHHARSTAAWPSGKPMRARAPRVAPHRPGVLVALVRIDRQRLHHDALELGRIAAARPPTAA